MLPLRVRYFERFSVFVSPPLLYHCLCPVLSIPLSTGYASLFTKIPIKQTLEGHLSSVLSLDFLNTGLQLLSGGADGLVKLWMLKTSECIKTFDEHVDKVSSC